MLVIQCALLIIAILLAAIAFMIFAFFNNTVDHQARMCAQLGRFRHELLGEHSEGMLFDMARDLEQLSVFAKDARKGLIPYLRYDDWYATEEDLDRWESAAIMEAAASGRKRRVAI